MRNEVAVREAGLLGSGDDYRLLFEASPVPMWVYTVDTCRILAVNDAAVAHFAHSRDEFLAMSVEDISGLAGAEIMSSSPISFGGHQACLVLAHDVTAERQLAVALRESDETFQEAQQLAHIGRWEWLIGENRVRWCDELYAIFGLSPQQFPATLEGYLARVHPDDRHLAKGNVERSLKTRQPFASDYRIVLDSGEVRWLHSRGRVVSDDRGRPVKMLGVCQDITSQKATEAALTRLALHDALTGLPNRALFVSRLELALHRLKRRDGLLAVVFIDLDRFKLINDGLGHAAGDQVLTTVAARLRQILRPEDTVARLGGDEFAVVCEGLASRRDAASIAERILTGLAAPMIVEGREVVVSASIGFALATDPETTPGNMLRDADTAMYQAKDGGRNRYEVFDLAARARNLALLEREEELRQALERSELRVFYQPEISIADGTTTGMEALVRWEHPVLGLLTPSGFIEVAEDTGLIVPLGDRVLKEACREAAGRGGHAPFRVSVNLSARQLAVASLLDSVKAALDESGLEPSRLCLEITESVLMEDLESSIESLLALKSLGVRLAIDDFGTGYSSLGYLRRFPVDVVKIDRSFVAGLGTDPAATAIVAAVVNLSHALGLSVVAEGVETEEQLVALRALRCDRAQGYYWSQALATSELGRWEHARRPSSPDAGPVDVHALLMEQTNAVRAATGRNVVLQVPATLGLAFGQPSAIRSVLGHLLANAVAYSGADRPIVVSSARDRQWLRVSVADFGTGMTGAEAARCFEQFWQADLAEGRSRRGPGIGLYIVRSLVETMGGHVAVRSAPGRGSTFTFALPRSARIAGRGRGAANPGMGEDSSIREFMRQIGIPPRRGA
jgi:diguanylate cyclase (GGDEF)-like protein/PAS domain S-box-containing protein